MDSTEKVESADIPRGKPKSGRVWKKLKTTRFSDNTRVKSQKTSWAVKMKRKEEDKAAKAIQQRLIDEKKAKKEALKMRREQNAKNRLENERKSEIVQPIKNTRKIKKMKKKTLRKIEKR
ncbi:coiled-coil domain-containing protein 86-like [Littorina saxatilis]|uniref:Coiled-coil domain-containing protein 86 n=1 Tax=Littorina saxatilis TaxID=31220 RepID=A0AAN9AI66_9CAEN